MGTPNQRVPERMGHHYLHVFVPFLFLTITLVEGHGNMVFPITWWDKNHAGWYWDEHGGSNHIGCGVLDLPEDNEYSNEHNGKAPDCMNFWFSNGVKIPGHATIPEYISQSDITCIHQAGAHDTDKKFPWNAPGTAPVYGPCGSLGGEPFGCNGSGEGAFGDCCSGNCDTFAFGENAENYHWPDAAVTEWKAGSYQEVAWYVDANHAGGYSYRICKMPSGGFSELTEECFQENPLEFVGEEQWVEYVVDKKTGHRTELKALQTSEGTFPAGSMWRANQVLPQHEEGGSSDNGHGHIIDYIKIPNNLEPGDYVVSFRWDCKCSPQVWGSCANVKII